MKKILTLILMAALFVACENDDDYFNDQIVGEWVSTPDSSYSNYESYSLVFNSDGTGLIKYGGYLLENGDRVDVNIKIKNLKFKSEDEFSYRNQVISIEYDKIVVHENEYNIEHSRFIKSVDQNSLILTTREGKESIFYRK